MRRAATAAEMIRDALAQTRGFEVETSGRYYKLNGTPGYYIWISPEDPRYEDSGWKVEVILQAFREAYPLGWKPSRVSYRRFEDALVEGIVQRDAVETRIGLWRLASGLPIGDPQRVYLRKLLLLSDDLD